MAGDVAEFHARTSDEDQGRTPVFAPRDVIERLNHLFATGDPNPIIEATGALALYTCDLIGPRECRFGADASDSARDEFNGFATSSGRFTLEFLDADVSVHSGSWVFKARSRDGRVRLCSLSVNINDEGVPSRLLLLSSRVKTPQ